MAEYRRKPITVEAYQFTQQHMDDYIAGRCPLPPGIETAPPAPYFVTTIHLQRAFVTPGDWIVLEPDGKHYYPVKSDIFRATYDPVAPCECPNLPSIEAVGCSRWREDT